MLASELTARSGIQGLRSLLTTVLAGPLTTYLTATADQLYAPEGYIGAVLGGE